MTAYPSSFAEFLSNLQEISNLKENDALAKKAFAEAESMANGWNTRYNSILVEKVETDYLSIKNGKVSDKEEFNELSMIYSSELVSLYNLNIVDCSSSVTISSPGVRKQVSNSLRMCNRGTLSSTMINIGSTHSNFLQKLFFFPI